jgi:hypothetical protein
VETKELRCLNALGRKITKENILRVKIAHGSAKRGKRARELSASTVQKFVAVA